MNRILTNFAQPKPLIGMIHLAALPGEPGCVGLESVKSQAISDIEKLQIAGLDGLLFENWQHDSREPFVLPETFAGFDEVLATCTPHCRVPYGINVLNNDYRAGFALAKKYHAAFVQLDVLVDRVQSDFIYSQTVKDSPFTLHVDLTDVKHHQSLAGDIPLLCSVQPKHYLTLPKNKSLEESIQQALEFGVDAIQITKATGQAPTQQRLAQARQAITTSTAIGLGSGLDHQNLPALLPLIDFAVVGSALKENGDAQNPVDQAAALQLVQLKKKMIGDK